MLVRLLNKDEDYNEVGNFESGTDLEGTIMIINEITRYCVDNNIYVRSDLDDEILFDVDANILEIHVEKM